MNNEDKQLLLTDLCGRLLHGVIIDYIVWNEHYGARLTGISEDGLITLDVPSDFPVFDVLKDEVKPYLRSLSSMTEEEMGEYAKFKLSYDDVYEFTDFRATGKGFINVHTSCKNGGCGYTFQFNNRTMLYDGVIGIDWLNKYHFDYRGLIQKGLALEAPEGMYNFK